MTAPAAAPCAAYGLRLNGVEAARELLGPALPGWPAYELSTRVGEAHDDLQWLRPDSARVRLAAGGHVELDRRRSRAVFTLSAPARAAELVHPHFASAAAVAGRWLERESFHAGALDAGGGAWVVLGDKGAGKSSLLALLALGGQTVVADDVAVVDRGCAVMAGPRLIDLRGDAAERLGTGRALGRVGLRERWRMSLGPAPALLPLRGFVSLAWSEDSSVEKVRPGQRLARLLNASRDPPPPAPRPGLPARAEQPADARAEPPARLGGRRRGRGAPSGRDRALRLAASESRTPRRARAFDAI